MGDVGRERGVIDQLEDPFLRRSIKTALHFRRYLPFYVFGTIWVLTLALFPSIRGGGDSANDLAVSGFGENVDAGSALDGSTDGALDGSIGTADGGSTATGAVAGSGGRQAGSGAAGSARSGASGAAAGAGGTGSGATQTGSSAPRTAAESVRFAMQATGEMRNGQKCAPGVRQVPVSIYATQCTQAFTGDNGGATYDGVSKDKIRIVRRNFPESANSQAADRINEQAGFASDDVAEQVRNTFIAHFQKTYELYGRQVEFIDYESQNGNSTEEAQGRGREGACADATKIKKDLKAFAVVSGSAVFGECSAALGLLVFQTGAYYPEVWFKKYHPFAWHYLMECERISYQVGEYVGKRLFNRNARFANDATYRTQKRKFGTYVPDNDEYQHCVNISNKEVAKYGAPKPSQYNYQLDLSRFADQAAQAAVQFKAAGVTTVVLACDPYSVIFLTQAATKQAWFPEWYLIGVAATDTDNLARLYDPNAVKDALFGMSQLGATHKILGPNSEPGRVYKSITGKEIPEGTTGSYYNYIHVFNMLQSAGPIVHPQTIAEGTKAIPPSGAPEFPLGYWSYHDGSDGSAGAGDHTMIDDSREIYWEADAKGPDGKTGTFVETYNGKRFRNNEWPNEEPPVYPGKK